MTPDSARAPLPAGANARRSNIHAGLQRGARAGAAAGPANGPIEGRQKPESARVFFALWPGPALRAGLHRAAVDGARRFGGRAMRPETLHLTLAFLGDVPAPDLARLREAAAGVKCGAFRLTLDRLGFWGHNRILWAGSREAVPGLSRLVDCLAGRLQAIGHGAGLETGRAFSPHVTLVRQVADKPVELPAPPPLDWDCEDFVLARSRSSERGSAYEIIGRWPLG